MKRENPETGSSGGGGGGGGEAGAAMAMKGKKKMMEAEEEQDAGDDELLAALGYKVRSSEMADVAQKLEQLEMAMAVGGNGADDDDALISHLASDTVHYNPSDLSSWLESMLSELNAPPPPPPPYNPNPQQANFGLHPPNIAAAFMEPIESSVITTVDFPQYDLKPPPAAVDANIYGPDGRKAPKGTKRMRTSSSPPKGGASAAAPPTTEVSSVVVVADSQEAGIRLVHALMACAEAVQQENLKAADLLVKQISLLAPSQGGAMRKVAGYFAEALARRIYHLNPQQDSSLDSAFTDILESQFYDSCPYLKFAHFTANQAILEAFAGCRRVHVIDFGMKQGMQWPALMQALALRPGGPPSFRLTGIGPPQPGNTDSLQQVGWKLAQFADTVGVAFEYRGFVASSLADLEPYMFEMPPGEEPVAVAVNSVFEMHRLLAQQGAVEKVLGTVRAINPRIMTVVEQESNHNAGRFVDRFSEALHYYSTMFDSLEGGAAEQQQDRMMSEVYLGRQMCNVLACEGADRTERHETLAQWRARFGSAGFEPVPLGSNAFKQASMLLALFAGADGYQVEEREGGLTLGWHTRPLIATSAWRVAGSFAAAAAAI